MKLLLVGKLKNILLVNLIKSPRQLQKVSSPFLGLLYVRFFEQKATKDSFLPRTGCNKTSRIGEVNILLTNPCWEPPKVIPKNIYIHEL